jgi:hypothetical protein
VSVQVSARYRSTYPRNSVTAKWTQIPTTTTDTRFGLEGQQLEYNLTGFSVNDPSDYNQKYPEDDYMEEMSDNARVWRVYNDEADRIDAEMVDGWRSTLDTPLIFVRSPDFGPFPRKINQFNQAGLFSAVIATFVTQATQNLQPNFSEITASLLTELVSIQRTAAINGDLSAVSLSNMTHDTPFTPARRDVILNGIWFVSLGLTLTTALLTGLVKQWLHFYIADVSGSAKERACTRQFRFMGLAAWGVPPIIEFLPVIMNASLLLFFVGLVLFCQGLSGTEGITVVIIILTGIPFVFYLGSSILPIVYPQCPYKSSLSTMLNLVPRIFWHLTIRIAEFVCAQPALARYISFHRDLAHFRRNELVERENALAEHEDIPRGIKILLRLSSMRGAESRAISHQRLSLQLQAITLMVTSSSNTTVSDIALQALAGLHVYAFSESSLPVFLWHHISETLLDWFPVGSNPTDNHHQPATPSVAERYSRALLCLINQLDEALTRPISMFIRSDPNDLRYLGLRALLAQHSQSRSFGNADQLRDALIRHVHKLPPIQYREIHPWIRAKLRQTILLGQRVPLDWDQMITDLARLLSPLKRPTLQMDVMLYQLERIEAPPTHSWDQDVELGTQAERVELVLFVSSLHTTILLISLFRQKGQDTPGLFSFCHHSHGLRYPSGRTSTTAYSACLMRCSQPPRRIQGVRPGNRPLGMQIPMVRES